MGRRKRLYVTSSHVHVDDQQNIEGEDETTDQESNNIEQNTEQGFEGFEEGTQKKRRGHTQKLTTWNMSTETKIVVTFNKFGKPVGEVGEEGNELTQFLGTLVRMAEHVGIQYADWRNVPSHKKDDIFKIVKSKFVFHPTETNFIKEWIYYNMGKKWRCWKGSLKARGYDPSLTVDEIVANLIDNDSRVNEDQVKELVGRWFTPDYERTCAVKRMSRSKMQEPHVTGTKSFARLAEEEATKSNGSYPTRGEIYRISHTRKDGSIVNDNAAQIMSSLQAVSSDSTNKQSTEDDFSNDDYFKVKGPEKRGYIRCVGRMPSAKGHVTTCSTDSQTVQQLKDGLACTQNVLSDLINLVKDHIPNIDLSGVLNKLNTQVPNTSPFGNQRSSCESRHNNGNRS